LTFQALMCTYGRWSLVCRAASCFRANDFPDKELLILNNHSVPLLSPWDNVRILNDPGHPTLGHCRNKLLSLSEAEFIRTWDDDDLYLPWTIEQGVTNCELWNAWKPARSWFHTPEGPPRLLGNAMEASITFKRKHAFKFGYRLSGGDEHGPLLAGGCAETELGNAASYVYRWGFGEWHISGSMGSGTEQTRADTWRSKHLDTGEGRPLQEVDLAPFYKDFPMDRNGTCE